MVDVTERRVYQAQLREAEVEGRSMTGLAAPYGETIPVGSYLETLGPSVFAKSIKEAARALPLLAFHNSESFPVGKAVEWEETRSGLVGTWLFDSRDEASEAHRMAAEGFISGLSVGFQPIRSTVDPGDDTTPPHVLREEARLLEVSLVPTPAYPSAQVTLVRTAGLRRNRPHRDQWAQWWEAKKC